MYCMTNLWRFLIWFSLLHCKVSKNQTGRKRKQPVSSSGPANSSGTANTAGPSPSSAPSTPSTHTPGDVISMPALPHSGGSSKPFMFGTDGTGTLTSPSNQLVSEFFFSLLKLVKELKIPCLNSHGIPFWQWDDKDLELQADMDRFVEDGSLEDNVDSFLSHDDNDPRDTVLRMDVSKGVQMMALFFSLRRLTLTNTILSSQAFFLIFDGDVPQHPMVLEYILKQV